MWDGWNKDSAEDMEQRKKYQDPIVLSAEITVDVFEANGGPEKVRLCDGKGAGYRC